MLSQDSTVVDVFNQSVSEYRANRAFTCLGHTLTFGDIDVLSARFAAYLQERTDLQAGDRIAIQLPNVLQYPVALFGALRAGLVVVNTNPLYTARETRHQLIDSGAKALVVLANVAAGASEIIRETAVEQVIVTEIADLHTPLRKMLINSYLKYVKKAIPDFDFPHTVRFSDVMATAEDRFSDVTRQARDLAVLQYTGGTTGVAKGAMLTHANLVANKEQLTERMGTLIREGRDTYVAPLPLYHIYAFTGHCMSIFSNGNHNLLIPNPRDIKSLVKAMKNETIYGFVGLNTLFNALCNNPEFHKLDFSSMGYTASGGMALTRDTARRWEEVTGVMPMEGYGLTETSPVVAANPPGAVQLGTVGPPVVGTEVKVIDEQGRDLGRDQAGELCVRGPQVMRGYWERPEATAAAIDKDGWFHTGDMAVIQADDYIKIVDRKKDMILVSGFNVYPNEVEDVATEHPGVLEAGAIGVPDEKSGEAVKLYVVKRDPAVTAEEIREYCRKNLTAYKVPKHIEFRDSIPKSAVGKILRRELRDEDDQ